MHARILRAAVLTAGILAPPAVARTTLAAPAAVLLQISGVADGSLEVRAGATVVARIAVKTPLLRRGPATLRQIDVDGHRLVDVRVPVRGTSKQEIWLGELGNRAPRVIWNDLAGARDADGEVSVGLEVDEEHVLEYQTASAVTRCDGAPPRLFARAFDFEAGRFRSVLSPVPPPAPQKLIARRGDPAMPPGRPVGTFHFTAASTTPGAGSDARGLTAPAALDDGDPATAWAEGLGGDGRGEFLTARAGAGDYAIRGLRIIPGDAASAQSFRAKNRVRRFQLALGPRPDQRFDVELPEDPGADPARFRQPYWVALPKPIVSSCVTVVLTDVVPGSDAAPPKNYGTTAISELTVFTELDGPEGAERLVADVSHAADCAARVPTLVGLGDAAVLPVAQAILVARGSARECLVEALTRLPADPKNAVVVEALVAAITAASDKEERLIAAALRRATAPPVVALARLLNAAAVPVPDRMRAARILAQLDDPRVPDALLAAVGHGPLPLRLAVAQALASAPHLGAEPLLAAARQSATEGVARQADLLRIIPAVVRREPGGRAPALATLHAALEPARGFEVRGRAVMALGALGPDALRELVAVREGSDEPVLRHLAARELSTLGGPEALAALRTALLDTDPRVRETAAQGLGENRDGVAGPAMIAGAKQEPWPFVRRAELEALGHVCVAGTGDLLTRAIERDVDEVRRAALVALVRCKDPRAKIMLLHTLGRRNEAATLRELAAALLGELGDHGAAADVAAALGRLVNESEADLALEGVAATTLRALAHLGGPEATAAAVTLAKDKRHPLRTTAIEALGILCDPGAGAATLRAIEAGGDASLAVAAQNAAKRCAAR
jgi:HEAT repeat protein